MRMNEWQDTSIARRKPCARAVDHAAVQVRLRGERDRVQREVEPAPAPFDRLEHRLELALDLDVERQEDRRLELLGQRLDVGLGLVVQIGDGELGAERAERPGAALGDRVLVGDADHEALLALEAAQVGIERHGSDGLVSVASGGSGGSRAGAARPACAGRSSAPRRSGSRRPRPGCRGRDARAAGAIGRMVELDAEPGGAARTPARGSRPSARRCRR